MKSRNYTNAYVWSVAALAVGLSALAISHLPPPPLLPTLAAVLIAVGLERLYEYQANTTAGNSAISPGVAVTFGALWVGGTVSALIVVVAKIAALSLFRHERRLNRLALNTSSLVLAALAAGYSGSLLGLTPSPPTSLLNFIALLAAVAAYFLANSITVSGAISLDTRSRFAPVWRQHFLWWAPQYLAMGLLGAVAVAAWQRMGLFGVVGFGLPLVGLYYSLRLYVRKAEANLQTQRELNERLEQTNSQLIEALATIVDARDALLYGHSAQVATYAVAIATEMGIGGEELQRIRKAALLHDVGKVAVSEAILFKPGPLTRDEYRKIQGHALVGERLVGLVDGLKPLAALVGQHHESWDGHGYPRGLSGEQIELGARILNLCDAVDTMLSDRPYKKGWPLPKVLDEVLRCRGTQFDPSVVQAMLRVLDKEGAGFFTNSAQATLVGLQRSALFAELRRLELNVHQDAVAGGAR